MADELLGGVLGNEDDKPEGDAPEARAGVEATAGAEAFAAAIAAIASRQDPQVARDTSAFLQKQARLLDVQTQHLQDEHALRLAHLAHQSHLLRGQRLGQVIRLSLQIVIALVVIVIGLGIAVMLHDAFTSHSVVIDTFDAPPALAARGLSGTVLAGEVLTDLQGLQSIRTTVLAHLRRTLSNGWSNKIKVDVPETGISLSEISRLLEARFGHDLHIGGTLVATDSGGLALTVYGDNILPKTFTGGAGALDSLTNDAAEYLFGQFQPVLWAYYLQQHDRCPEAINLAKSIYTSGSANERAGTLAAWGLCLQRSPGSLAESVRLLQTATQLQPDLWNAYIIMSQELITLGDEEGAWRALQGMRHAAASLPSGDQPGYYLFPWDDLLEDHLAALRLIIEDSRAHGVSLESASYIIPMEQVRLHDTAAAQLSLLAADARSPTADMVFDVVQGLLAVEAGDAEQAAVELQMAAAKQLSVGDPPRHEMKCLLAPAAAAAGHADVAGAVIQRGAHLVDCQSARGDILDYHGDWAGAQQAYAQAVALAPDLPQGYYSWGNALARHGDVAGAIAKLKAANQRGPHWADPLKAWGDALVRQRHVEQALEKYDEAIKYAPNWAALKQARDAAGKPKT